MWDGAISSWPGSIRDTACSSSCASARVLLRTAAVGEGSGCHAHKAGHWGQRGFTEGVLLKSAATQSWYLPLESDAQPAVPGGWQLPAPAEFSQALWENCCQSGIGNARSVWARRCGTTCRNAAGAVSSCSCTRQPPHRHFFKCTGLLNQGGGIATLKRKTGACSA